MNEEDKIDLKGTTLKELVYDMRKDLSYLIKRFEKDEEDRKGIINEIRDIDKRLLKTEMNNNNGKFLTIVWSVISAVTTAVIIHFVIKKN